VPRSIGISVGKLENMEKYLQTGYPQLWITLKDAGGKFFHTLVGKGD
jgi:hypothetical protein